LENDNEGLNLKDISEANATTEKTKRKLGKVVVAEIINMNVIVKDHQDARIIYDNGYYGTLEKDKTLTLHFEETLHLLERGVIKVTDELGVWVELDDCARLFTQKDEGLWTDYLVYKDLRNRGYIVSKTMICPLSEGRSINLGTLDEIVTQTQSLKKRLLIACVDRLGDVSYYELQPLFTK